MTEQNGTVEVSHNDEGLEASPLTGASLLLDGHDLEDLVLESAEEVVDDLVLLDRERVQVDLFEFVHLSGLDKATQLGGWHPGLFFIALVATLATPAATRTSTSTASTTKATTFTGTPPTSLLGRSSVSHLLRGVQTAVQNR